ncbi:MAG: hypothetical protein A4E57_03562 [Syntrophorhabdaceae bacterium PtaU1.Bin034]|jgi:AbrB family looped-hinge helix DNA binding protein|nr:MAG: hypothetical protein A4E57_03562 [Syntrophorhabdaceae bacterium PtaU1.Bin034]
MRITSKGQITIPQEIREKTGLLPYTEVEFQMTSDGKACILRTKNVEPKERLVARMKGRATVKMSTDEIMKLTRRG